MGNVNSVFYKNGFNLRYIMSLIIYIFLLFCISRGHFNSPTKEKVMNKGEPLIANMESHLNYEKDTLLVRYKKDTDKFTIQNIQTNFRLLPIDYTKLLDIYLYKIESGQDSAELISQLKKQPGIDHIELNYLVRLCSILPNDPRFNEQWALNNIGQIGGIFDADIDAPEAWGINRNANEVIIGIIDSGIDYNHEDLRDNMWVNNDEIPNDNIDNDNNGYIDDIFGINADTNKGDCYDETGHGTKIAGIIASVGNNGIGMAGVCWKAKLMALKFVTPSHFIIIKCFEYAIKKGVHILNTSWITNRSKFLIEAIEAAREAGILIIAASGNNEENIDLNPEYYYPASYRAENIVSVAASDQYDKLAQFSNYGKSSVHVAAPGVSILTTFPENKYGFVNGTSASTAIVTGIAALIKGMNPFLNYRDLKNKILNGIEKNENFSEKILTSGRVNAFNSLVSSETFNYMLTVKSAPWEKALIEVIPPDINGESNGITTFQRVYPSYTKISCTAPEYHNGRKFGHWLLDGKKVSDNNSLSIILDYDRSIEAVYPLYNIEIKSWPDENVYIDISPIDDNGQGGGFTNFSRKYQKDIIITIKAPQEHNGKKFVLWKKNLDGWNQDQVFSYNSTISIKVQDNLTITAIYFDYEIKFIDLRMSGFDYFFSSIGLDKNLYVVANSESEGRGLLSIKPDGGIKWFLKIPGIQTSPVIGFDGTIYCKEDKSVIAVNPTGKIRWQLDLQEPLPIPPPSIGPSGVLYLGSYNSNYLTAIEPSGKIKWRFMADGYVYSPAIDNGENIYFLCSNGYFYSVNSNGNINWMFKTDFNPIYGGPIRCMNPAIDNDNNIYFGVEGGSFYCLDKYGKLKWKYKPISDVTTSPIIDKDRNVYFGGRSCDEMIAKLDKNGNLKWRFSEKESSSVFSAPIIDATGLIYFGSYNGNIYCISSEGKLVWKIRLADTIYEAGMILGPEGTIYIIAADALEKDKFMYQNNYYLFAIKTTSKASTDCPWPMHRHDCQNSACLATKFRHIEAYYWLRIYTTTGGTTIPSPAEYEYKEGSTVFVTAVPYTHYRFSRWTGDILSNENPISLIMDRDISITANFLRVIYPPLNAKGQKILTRSLLQAEYINVLSWEANPDNENIKYYKIYLIDGTQKTLLATLPSSDFEYWHRKVNKEKTYIYWISAVDSSGREGEPAIVNVR